MFGILLKKYRLEKGFSLKDIAEKLNELLGGNFIHSSIQSYEAGTNPKLEVITALANILDIPVQYLFNDNEQILNKITIDQINNNPEKYRHNIEAIHNMVDVKKVALLDGYAGAGSTGLSIDNHLISTYIFVDNSCINQAYKKEEVRAIEVIGDSMFPYVDNFDIVLFTPVDSNFQKINNKYVIETESGLMVKNITFKLNGDVIVSSENKSYVDEIIDKDRQQFLNIVGLVVGRILKS